MASDQDPKMDELLRAYAKKRKEAAGEPLQLHAATRKMLQAEVARTYKQTEREAEAAKVFSIWRRLIWGTAAVAVVVIAVITIVPAFHKGQSREMKMAAANRAPVEPQLAPAATPAPSMPAGRSGGRAVETRQRSELADMETGKLESTISRDKAALRAPAENQPEVPIAAPSAPVALAEDLRKDQEETKPARSLAAAVPPTPAKTVPATTAATAVNKASPETLAKTAEPELQTFYDEAKKSLSPSPGIAQNFAQQDLRAQYRRNYLSPPPATVLTNFQVVWSGTTVKVIDSDGSIYEGSLAAAAEKSSEPLLTPRAKQKALAVITPAQPRHVRFTASGESKTLHRQIVLQVTNVVVPPQIALYSIAAGKESVQKKAEVDRLTETAKTPIGGSGGTSQPSAAAIGDAVLEPKTVIEGTVTVGGTNQFPIKAVEKP